MQGENIQALKKGHRARGNAVESPEQKGARKGGANLGAQKRRVKKKTHIKKGAQAGEGRKDPGHRGQYGWNENWSRWGPLGT